MTLFLNISISTIFVSPPQQILKQVGKVVRNYSNQHISAVPALSTKKGLAKHSTSSVLQLTLSLWLLDRETGRSVSLVLKHTQAPSPRGPYLGLQVIGPILYHLKTSLEILCRCCLQFHHLLLTGSFLVGGLGDQWVFLSSSCGVVCSLCCAAP